MSYLETILPVKLGNFYDAHCNVKGVPVPGYDDWKNHFKGYLSYEVSTELKGDYENDHLEIKYTFNDSLEKPIVVTARYSVDNAIKRFIAENFIRYVFNHSFGALPRVCRYSAEEISVSFD